jgi:putative redox protein
MSRNVEVTSGNTGYLQNISIGPHQLQADEQFEVGGRDSGPNPYELLLAALGSCTSMTIRMYADRKRWPLEMVRVRLKHGRVHAEDCMGCETKAGFVDRIEERSSWSAS